MSIQTFTVTVRDRRGRVAPATYEIATERQFEAEIRALDRFINERGINRPAVGQSRTRFFARFNITTTT